MSDMIEEPTSAPAPETGKGHAMSDMIEEPTSVPAPETAAEQGEGLSSQSEDHAYVVYELFHWCGCVRLEVICVSFVGHGDASVSSPHFAECATFRFTHSECATY